MSQIIIEKVKAYLSGLDKGIGRKVEFKVLGEYTERIASTLRKSLNPHQEREFHLVMSNVGRPGCVLQAEKEAFSREHRPYSNRYRNLYGDMVEASAVAIMKQAGVNITSEQERVTLAIAGVPINGVYDLTINEEGDKVYDVKSASSYTFKHKYSESTLASIWKDGDPFGYIPQLYGYAEARGLPVGGLIIINKETGEWLLVPPPPDEETLKIQALGRIEANVKRIISNEPFRRDFTDVAETYRKHPTGNRILCNACSLCDFRETCWPGVQHLPQPASKGQSPRYYYYTKLKEEKDNKE